MRPQLLSLVPLITACATAFIMRPAVRSGHRRINSIVDDLCEHDVVEYATDDGGLGLGVVCEDGSIHPLCYFVEEEDGPVDYVWDEEVDAVVNNLRDAAASARDQAFALACAVDRGVPLLPRRVDANVLM